jgi:hypothetical protein
MKTGIGRQGLLPTSLVVTEYRWSKAWSCPCAYPALHRVEVWRIEGIASRINFGTLWRWMGHIYVPVNLLDGLFTRWAPAMTLWTSVSWHCSYSNPMVTAFGKDVVTCIVSLLLVLALVFVCCEYDGQIGQRVILNEAPCCSGTDTYRRAFLFPVEETGV